VSSDWEAGRRELTQEDIDAILAFLPAFEQPGYTFGEWRPYHDERTGEALPMAYCFMAADVQAFMEALYEHHWMYPFDWTSRAWQRRMSAIRDDPARMAKTRLETMRKMLITYARADRFCDGALVEACERGYVLAILRRVKELAGLSSDRLERRPGPR
jgi:hypothetical protein